MAHRRARFHADERHVGFSTAAAFCEEMLQETQQSVLRNIKIAKVATPAEIATFTVTTLRYGSAYVEAKSKAPIANRGAIDFEASRFSTSEATRR